MDYSVSISGSKNNKVKIVIDKTTNFIQTEEEYWFNAELYLQGEIKEWGGKSKTNIHIETTPYGTVIVDIPAETLRSETRNRVYKDSVILVSAKQNIETGEIKDVRFLDFIEYSPKFDEDELNELVEKGTEAWKDIEDASDWVRNLRGEI